MYLQKIINEILPHKNDKISDKITFYVFLYMIGGMIIPENRLIGSIISLYAYLNNWIILYKYKEKRNPFEGITSNLFSIFIFFDLICVIIQSFFRGEPVWNNEFLSFLSYFFVVSNYYPAFLLPLLVFINKRHLSLHKFIQLTPIMSIICFIGLFLGFDDILNQTLHKDFFNNETFDYSQFSLFPSIAFCLFLLPFLKNKKKYCITWAVGVLTLIIFILFARRGSALFSLLYLLISCCIFFIVKFKKQSLLIIFFFSFIIIIFSSYFYSNNKNSFFQNIYNKGLTDTRENVEKNFKDDIFNSVDFIWGRGMNGQYYSPKSYKEDGHIVYKTHRYSIETGFYHLILKGGIIFTILYLLVLIIPAIKGLFKSNNVITRIFAIWILLSIIELYPFGWPSYDMKYYLIWIGAVICNSKVFRNMNNQQICNQLNIK